MEVFMKKLLSTLTLLAFVSTSYAGSDLELVDAMDTAREGNLSQLVLANYKKTQKEDCDLMELPKYEIVKISSGSSNHEKTADTPYGYEATYVVIQKCLSGSTFQGAYSDLKKAITMKGSFDSDYNAKGGPAKMRNLKIEVLKNVYQQ